MGCDGGGAGLPTCRGVRAAQRAAGGRWVAGWGVRPLKEFGVVVCQRAECLAEAAVLVAIGAATWLIKASGTHSVLRVDHLKLLPEKGMVRVLVCLLRVHSREPWTGVQGCVEGDRGGGCSQGSEARHRGVYCSGHAVAAAADGSS